MSIYKRRNGNFMSVRAREIDALRVFRESHAPDVTETSLPTNQAFEFTHQRYPNGERRCVLDSEDDVKPSFTFRSP